MVADGGFGGQEVAESCEVGEVEDFGKGFVEMVAGGAVVHGREALELGIGHLVEEVGETLKLGWGECADVKEGQFL